MIQFGDFPELRSTIPIYIKQTHMKSNMHFQTQKIQQRLDPATNGLRNVSDNLYHKDVYNHID